jgi:hypothetical protein
MLWIVSADPPCPVHTPQGHFIRRLAVPFVKPFLGQVWPPNRQRRVLRGSGLLGSTDRTASIAAVPVIAASAVRWVTPRTHPKMLPSAALGHLAGRRVAGMPFLGKPGIFGHRLAFAKAPTPPPTYAERADYVSSVLCEQGCCGIPFMPRAASVDAAWAPQPYSLTASVCEVCRQLAQVEGGVPHALDSLVISVSQRLFAFIIDARACEN